MKPNEIFKPNPRADSELRADWRIVVNTIDNKIAGRSRTGRVALASWLKLGLWLVLGGLAGVAGAQPANDMFATAAVISGLSGTNIGSNVGATLEACETNAVNCGDDSWQQVDNSVWYAWTAPATGTAEFNTIGSGFDTVLSIWTTTNGLCDASLTNLVSDDDTAFNNNLDTNNYTSYLTFPAVAGTTYYISVDGNALDFGDDSGPVVLNWNLALGTVPTIPSGTFQFTANSYPVSSLGGSARVTVTRVGGSSGRVLVDYATVLQYYTNQYTTNYYGTNISTTLTDTNTGNLWVTNASLNYIVYSDIYQFYVGGGYTTYTDTGAFTNSSLQTYTITNVLVGTNYPVVSTPLVPVPTNLPPVTNTYVISLNNNNNNGLGTFFTNYTIFSTATTNLVSGVVYTNGTKVTNSPVVYTNFASYYTNTLVTNYYGTNILVSFTLLGGGQSLTNYYYTNIVTAGYYYTNAVYTNGLLSTNLVFTQTNSTGTNKFAWSYTNNVIAGSATSQNSGTRVFSPTPTAFPPLGTHNLGGGTNSYRYVAVTNPVVSASGNYFVSTNTITFDDYQMSQDIYVQPAQDYSLNGIPISAQVGVQLLNPRLDGLESASLEPPTLSLTGSNTVVSTLNAGYPAGPALFNFGQTTYQVDKDAVNIKISVTRSGNLADGVSVQYVIDPGCANWDGGGSPPVNYVGGYCPANQFPLQAGSDYATPNSDYTPVSGTLSWGANNAGAQIITIPILNNGLVENNADFHVQLYNPLPKPTSTDVGAELGLVNAASVTIYFAAENCGQQPAGAVDRCWNPEGSSASIPPFLSYPGTQGGVSGGANGNSGTVYAVAEQPNGETIVAGSFTSYDSNPYNRIVRVLNDGYQDSTFQGVTANNSGANNFIAALALYPASSTNFGKILIGGNFTAFNGYSRYHIARLNSDGSLDSSFNPGLGVRGANAMVWSIALQTNDQVVIAGSFSTVNGTNCNSVARLNADGSLDTSFNPGLGPDNTVNAVVVDPTGKVIIGGDFENVGGGLRGGVARLNVDGSLDTTFDPGIGTYNPDTGYTDPVYALALQPDGNLLVGGSLSYFGLTSYNGIVRLAPDGSVDTSFNPGSGPYNGTYNPVTGVADTVSTITLQPDGKILIGGDFTTYNQTRRVGLARLFSYGSLDTSFMDTYYNQFAGVPNHYFNPDAVSTNGTDYPQGNQRNFVDAIALEPGTTNVIIGGGFLRVGGGFSRDDIHPRSNVARLIGGATPGPGNIELTYNKYTVDKSAPTLFVTLDRTNGSLGAATATFSTNMAAPGPGIASTDDFSLPTNYDNPVWPTLWSLAPIYSWLTSPAVYGQNNATVPVAAAQPYVFLTISNNAILSGNVNANFALSNPESAMFLGGERMPLGVALGWQDTAAMTILDDNFLPGVLGFSSPTYTVNENGTNATITVTRTNFTGGVVQVSYATSNGTATNGMDYTATTGTLTFQAGDSSKTFTIPIIKGTTTQPDKTVNLTLYTPAGGATIGQTNAVLTIVNNNGKFGHLGFTSANYSANENGGTALIGVSRLGASAGIMSVTVMTANGTATNGLNYVGTTNVLSWASGDVSAKFLSIPLIHDGIYSSNLTVNLLLTNGVYGVVTNNAVVLGYGGTNAVLTIVNVDFPGTLEFSTGAYSVKKYGGYALIPVVRAGGSAGTVAVNYTTADGTALAGSDYTATNGTLTFTNGQVAEYFNVPITAGANDGFVSLNLVLTNAVVVGNATPWNALGSPSNAVLNIIDTTTVNEIPGSPDVTYNAFGFNGPVYALALEPNNQLLVGGDFTFADGVYRQRLARLNADGSLDSSFSLPTSTMGADASVRAVAIRTDGRILVGGYFTNLNSVAMHGIARLNADGSLDSQFNAGSGANSPVYAVAETFVNGVREILVGGGFSLLNGQTANGVGRLNDDGTPDINFNVGGLGANGTVYALAVQSDGRILIGGDFTQVNTNNVGHIARLNVDGSVDLTFTNASANGSVRAITIQPDGQILAGGLFTSVSGNTNFNHIARLNSADGSPDSTFTPGFGANDAVFSIALQTDSRIVVGGQFTQANGVTRNRITRLNPDGTVDPTINFGAGADSSVAAVVVQEDTIAGYPTNVPDEKIIIGGSFLNYYGVSHPYLARIYGGSVGGSGAFTFSSANYGVNENGGNVVITVNRTGGTSGTNTDGSGDIYVPFATSDGTALANTDHAGTTNYFTVITNLDFPMGEVQKTIAISVLDDQVITSNLTVNLAVNPVPPAEYGDQPTALLTITNVDSSISFSAATYLATKYGSNVVSGFTPIYVSRNGATFGTSTVVFSTTTNGTATAGVDYQAQTNVLLTFAPGVTSQQVNIPIINGVSDGSTTVGLQLTNVTGSALYNPSNAVLTILDQTLAKGSFMFSSSNYVVSQGASQTFATITVLRTNGASGIVSINYNTADGTALAGVQYIATAGTLTFGDGVTSQNFTVPVYSTSVANVALNLSLLLSNPTGGAGLMSPTNATLTILNTNTGFYFAAATNTAPENSGFVTLTVLRNNTNGLASVDFFTADGTGTNAAINGTNYVGQGGTLVFVSGQLSTNIIVPLIYNPLVTGDLQFTVGLTNPNNAQLIAPSVTTVIEQDADAGLSFASATTSVFKNGTNAVLAVVCSNPRVEPVTAGYYTADGTATNGIDYVGTSGFGSIVFTNGIPIFVPGIGSLVFAGGITTNYITIPILNDQLLEGNVNFSVVLTNAAYPGQLVSPSTNVVTIIDSNSGISFSSSVYAVAKTGVQALINVYRTGYTDSVMSVDFATTNGTAVSGPDYMATNGTLVFTNGVTNLTFAVTVVNKLGVQPPKTVLLSLLNPTNAIMVVPTNATLTILNNTNAAFAFAAATNPVAASAGSVTLNVLRLNNPNGTATVGYATADGTATAGNNYQATNGTLTFTNGVTALPVNVSLINNTNLVGNFSFTLSLTNPGSPAQLIAPSNATVVVQYAPLINPSPDFTNPVVIGGNSGSATVDNTGVLPDTNAPSIAGILPNAQVWFAWTPTNSGEVEFDTIGSYATNGTKLDTVLGVYTGTNLATLNLVAANDDLYPNYQYNYVGQNIYTFGDTNNYYGSTNPPPTSNLYGSSAYGFYSYIPQPFQGPSGLRFNATAGTTYYVAVDTKPYYNDYYYNYSYIYSPDYLLGNTSGLISLNWSLHPSGVFRFATENSDQTGITNADGTPMLLYQCAATEGQDTTVYGGQVEPYGVLVTVTRVAGSYGRVTVDYATADLSTNSALMGTNGYLINGDLPASSTEQLVTNGFSYQYQLPDYFPASGTLTFDDYEMSKSFVVQVDNSDPTSPNGILTPRPNRDFMVVLSNPQVDPAESSVIPAPRVDKIFGQTLVRILDVNSDPRGGNTYKQAANGVTNILYTTIPTNAVFNFQSANYWFDRLGGVNGTNNQVTYSVYVNRTGTNNAAQTISYNVNSSWPFEKNAVLVNRNNSFPLQAGSDYATPNPPNSGGVEGKVADFNFPGGYTGTVSWGANDFNPKPISFTIFDNQMPQFNEDFQIDLYDTDKNGNVLQVGMMNACTVTILPGDFTGNQAYRPAGSVDELYNADYGEDFFITTTPPQMPHPGTDGEVYGLAVQPDDKAIVVGDFFAYDQTARNCIARATAQGFLDATFNPGSGANDFISCVTLTTNNEVLIGGAFTSFNGSLCDGIALLQSNGSLDTSFNPGLGFNGTVNTLALQPNGQILVGGNFTSYNGTPRNYLARINPDGSLDTTFNPGTALNAQVLALTLQASGQVVVGGDFTSAGGVAGQDYLARLNADGSFDPGFDPGSGANAAVLALATQPDGNILVGGEFSKLNGQNLNSIGRLTANGYLDPNFYGGIGVDGPVYSLTVQPNFIYVGGAFTKYNGTHRLGFARLYYDGTLDTTFLDTAYNQFAGLTREHYGDPLGTVLTSGVQSDGGVLIGGFFSEVGGGEWDGNIRPESYTNAFTFYETRASIRNHSNLARLLGGATPGPGNVGLSLSSYSSTKSGSSSGTNAGSQFFVELVRTNGLLGAASANFSVAPGLAQSGVDYSYVGDYNGASPLYWILWQYAGPTRMHSDGFYGNNLVSSDGFNTIWSGINYADVYVTLTGNEGSLKNLNAQFQLSNPAGADQFYLGGENIPLGTALGESAAPFTLIDDHHASGTFGFSSSSYVGTGSSASIGILRTNGSYGVVSLKYATTTNGSTAVLNSDYTAASGTLTFQPSDTLKTFNVPVLSSNYITSVEKFVNLQLSGLNAPANGLATYGISNAVLRIINPSFQGFLNLSSNAYAANLSAGSVAITVTRTVGSLGTLNVQFATTDGTAVSGTDYTGTSTNLQWNSGDVSPRTIVIPLLNSHVLGTNKVFGVALSNPIKNTVSTPSLLGATTNATVTIINDNYYGTLQFSAPSYVVNENGGYSTVTVVRTGATNGTATVHFATTNATAFAGTNYVATNGVLTFVSGQLAASFNVPILDDGKTNPPPASFFFQVNLSNPGTGVALGSPTNANVSIVDAESYNRPPGSADTTFNLGAGMNGDVFALALQSGGQILAGGNFTTVNGVPENYLARLNSNGTLDRSGFLYGLSGASGAVYALVDQTDDQILVGGAFTNINGTVLNRVARLNTDGSLDSSFNPGAGADNTVYALAETFIGGAREIYAGGAFSLMNGVSRPGLVRLNNNGTVDTAFSTGTGPNAPVYAVAVYPTNSLFAGQVLVGGAFSNINNFAVGCIARLNGDGSMDTNFDLNLNASGTVRAIAIQNDGRILIGGDFTNVDGVPLNHLARLNPDGSLDSNFTTNVVLNGGANGTVNAIALQADGRIVVTGQFTQASGVTRNNLTRLMPDGTVDPTINFGDGANGAVNAVVVQPADQMLVIGGSFTQYNDQPAGHIVRIYGGSETGSGVFLFTSAGYQVAENGVQALIGVRRVGGTSGTNANGSGNVFVNFATSPGTAVPNVNYLSVITNVVFPPGEVLQLIPVPVMDDFVITNNLTVNLTLSNPSAGTALGNQATALLTILNVDSAVSFTSINYSVAKNVLTGYGTVNVMRLGTTNGTASVDYLTTTNGSAVIGTDYYPTNGTIVFNPGVTNVTIQVPIINNNLPEGNRTVILALTNAVNTMLYAPSNTTLTIIDTVQAPGLLAFSATNYVANSSDGTAYVTVVRTNGHSGTVSVAYTTVAGTAVPGVNYQTASGTLTFNDGDTSKTFAVPLLYQLAAPPSVSLSLQLSNPTGGAALTSPTNATLTLLNTNVIVSFATATSTFAETNLYAAVSVLRYNNTAGTNTVYWSTTNGPAVAGIGAALAGINYSAITNQALTFYPGVTNATVFVPLLYDTNVTGPLQLTVGLASSTPGVVVVPPSTTTVVLLDADTGLSFSTNAGTVLKNAGSINITVTCSNTNVEPVSVNYATSDGTATAGTDYSATSGTLTFSNGVSSLTFPVPITNNGLITSNRVFYVNLSNPTGTGRLVSPSQETVTIIDSNSGLLFSSAAYTVLKTNGPAVITVYRTDNTNTTSTVNYLATNGTAFNGVNFVTTSGTLVFTNGVTSQIFTVPIIPTATVQPDLTVLLTLSAPVNGTLLTPSAATLTIRDNSGSYVIPAGSQMVTNYTSLSDYTNDVIGSNDTVQVLFALRDASLVDVTNLIATLLPTNGVTAPNPSSQTYGYLTHYGHSVSMPFTFTAHGSNNQQIAATFNLQDGSKSIGTAIFGYTLGTTTTVFSNNAVIVINDNAAASPYPSVINVSGVGGSLLKATVTLNKFAHTDPHDVSALVTAPAGTNTLIMAHAGGNGYGVTNLVLTFDDAATNSLPSSGAITNGTYKPTRYSAPPKFP